MGAPNQRLQVKAKLLRELQQYARGGMADELRNKYRPKPPPVEEPAVSEAPPAPEQSDDADLTGLDEATISRLLGE